MTKEYMLKCQCSLNMTDFCKVNMPCTDAILQEKKNVAI